MVLGVRGLAECTVRSPGIAFAGIPSTDSAPRLAERRAGTLFPLGPAECRGPGRAKTHPVRNSASGQRLGFLIPSFSIRDRACSCTLATISFGMGPNLEASCCRRVSRLSRRRPSLRPSLRPSSLTLSPSDFHFLSLPQTGPGKQITRSLLGNGRNCGRRGADEGCGWRG